MKELIIELDNDWVLSHRDDDSLPADVIAEGLKEAGMVPHECTFTSVCATFSDSDIPDPTAVARGIIAAHYPDVKADDVAKFDITSVTESRRKGSDRLAGGEADGSQAEETKGEKPERTGNAESARTGGSRREISSPDDLVGADEFKALLKEIAAVGKKIAGSGAVDLMAGRCYLFSIGDGCGLTTYLNLLARTIEGCGIWKFSSDPVRELRLGPYKDGSEPFEEAIKALMLSGRDKASVLLIDISEWMGKTDDRMFKQFLRAVESAVEKKGSRFVIVFRLPFVDKNILSGIARSLSDLLSITTVSFPPFSKAELGKCAEREFGAYGFTLTKGAWNCFFARIAEEKSDGRFYGLNTVRKVVKDFVYRKYVCESDNEEAGNVIETKDVKALVSDGFANELSGAQQLDRLVGGGKIRERINEIVAQIESAVATSGSDRPCIHMRFVGNPGTGKTTVARIIGKILKEKGILRVGGFIECSGRDLCGKYIGETAPKTAGICRDAYGSVLFIDEAYSLYRGDGNERDYGREALETLIAEMENHRNDFVVVMAGYTDEMNKLMEGNAGLKSRMPYTIEFPNFTRDELNDIFVSMASAKFRCDPGLFEAADSYFSSLPDEYISSKEFANARFVRNLFERTWAKAAMRCQLASLKTITLTKEDFGAAVSDGEFAVKIPKKTRMGF